MARGLEGDPEQEFPGHRQGPVGGRGHPNFICQATAPVQPVPEGEDKPGEVGKAGEGG